MEYKSKYMKEALKEAKKAQKNGEVPIGAVVVLNGEIVGRGHNERIKRALTSAHAEMLAIEKANKKLGDWRLDGAELYVTLEPCPMCMGAVLNSRIKKVYFGAYEQKGRSLTGVLASSNLLNHTVEVEGGVLEEECKAVLSGFFSAVRVELAEDKPETKHYVFAFKNKDGEIYKIGVVSGEPALKEKIEKQKRKNSLPAIVEEFASLEEALKKATLLKSLSKEELNQRIGDGICTLS